MLGVSSYDSGLIVGTIFIVNIAHVLIIVFRQEVWEAVRGSEKHRIWTDAQESTK